MSKSGKNSASRRNPLALLGGVPALTAALLAYTVLGALAIMWIENRTVPPANRGLTSDRADTAFLFRLYEIRTSKLISREKFAETAVKEMEKWQEVKANLDWDFCSAFLYCFTLHTTIGYGHVAARSPAGKLFSALYALVGIPLCLVYIGRLAALIERQISAQLRANCWRGSAGSGLTLGATAAAFGAYCCLGAGLFLASERWNPLDGAYFAVISATSIGLGDLVPGHNGLLRTVSAIGYLTLGLALCTLLLNQLNERLASVLGDPVSNEPAPKPVHAEYNCEENSKER